LALEMTTIVVIIISVTISCAIPLLAGVAKGHVPLGIIGALITLPLAALIPCPPVGLLVGGGLAALINMIPKINKELLSQSEIEAEMRKIRGY
jgi:hypothetical protein